MLCLLVAIVVGSRISTLTIHEKINDDEWLEWLLLPNLSLTNDNDSRSVWNNYNLPTEYVLIPQLKPNLIYSTIEC